MKEQDYIHLSEKTEKKFTEGLSMDGEQSQALYVSGFAALSATVMIDLMKRHLIYGKPLSRDDIAKALPDFDIKAFDEGVQLTQEQAELLHHALGLFSEAGEVFQQVFDHVLNGKELDRVNLKEEIGDIAWYQAGVCRILGTTFGEEWARNIAKLAKRYPEKYSDEAALNRDLDAERKILEG